MKRDSTARNAKGKAASASSASTRRSAASARRRGATTSTAPAKRKVAVVVPGATIPTHEVCRECNRAAVERNGSTLKCLNCGSAWDDYDGHEFYDEKDVGGSEPILVPKWPISPETTADQLVETWDKGRGHRVPIGGPDRAQLVSMIAAAIQGSVDTATGKTEAHRRIINRVTREVEAKAAAKEKE